MNIRLLCFLWFVLQVSLLAAGRDPAFEQTVSRTLAASTSAEVGEAFRAATEALDKRDFRVAVDKFTVVLVAQPRHDVSLRRRAAACLGLGERQKAFADNHAALEIERSGLNLLSAASNLMDDAGTLRERRSQLKEAMDLLYEAATKPDSDSAAYWATRTYCALRLDSLTEMRHSASVLLERFPREAVSHYYAAIIAATDEHWLKAEDEVEEARALGLPDQQAEALLASGIRSGARPWHWAQWFGSAAAIWLVGMTVLLLLGWWLSAATLKQAERASSGTATPAELSLRRIYRWVINVAATYYYLSLPLTVVAVLALAAGGLFLMLSAGFVAVKLVLFLGIGAVVTVGALIKTLFVRTKTEDVGRLLKREEAPGVYALAEEVAAKVGTRPVDEIRVLPGTELAVYERGTRRQKQRDEASRILLLGTGVLDGFSKPAFQSVLAHEYGHFAHRDTAGGDVAFRVMRDMMLFYRSMAEQGVATWYNIAFHFLRFYHFTFRRITAGATRLQEILADRVAAHLYGGAAFKEGLTHVIRRSVQLDLTMGKEFDEAIAGRRSLQNVYTRAVADEADFEEKCRKALEAPTTLDDTHPSPQDRFRMVGDTVGREPTLPGKVWELFSDRDALTLEMLRQMETWVSPHRKMDDEGKHEPQLS